MANPIRLATRARAWIYTVITSAFTLIFVIAVLRMASATAWYETALVLALTIAMAFATRRNYRMTRARRKNAA